MLGTSLGSPVLRRFDFLRPFTKFITTEASQGGVIALTTAKITRQHDIFSVSEGTTCGQILWSDSPWTGGAWENYYESQGYKSTATCKECGFKELCVLTSFMPTEVLPSPPSLPPSWCCLKCPSPEVCVLAVHRFPAQQRNYSSAGADANDQNRRMQNR